MVSRRNPLPKNKKTYQKEGQKPRCKNEKNKSEEKNVQASAVAAAAATAAALHVDVDEEAESDFGGGYSDWSSDSYEGVVAHDSPHIPLEVKKKKKKHSVGPKMKTSGSGGAKKDDSSSSSTSLEHSVSPDHQHDPDWLKKGRKDVMLVEGKVVQSYIL